MALPDTQSTRRIAIKPRQPWGPKYPVRFQTPDIIRMCSDWQNYQPYDLNVGTQGATLVANSGRIFKANCIRDPDFNAGASAGSSVDYTWMIAAGYRYWCVDKTEVKVEMWSTSASQQNNYYKCVAFMATSDTPIPGPAATYSEMQFVIPKMKSKPLAHPYETARTRMNFSCKTSFEWPARNVFQDVENWGQFDTLGTIGVDPPNVTYLWIGAAADYRETGANAIGLRMKVHLRFHVTIVRDPLIRIIPGNFNDNWIPASLWTPLEGYGENPDDTGAPAADIEFAPTGVAADLTGESSQTQWYDNP